MAKHYTIPVFVPELACPFRCIFCNQSKISGQLNVPSPAEAKEIIDAHLVTIPKKKRVVEIGFFGGNFTGIPHAEQEAYLQIAFPYLEKGIIDGIRLSTRPDYIDHDVLALLKKYGVSTIELGAQSFDDEVLQLSGRGHSVRDTIKASRMIQAAGFKLGLQMMVGLPGDTPEKAVATAEAIAELGADNTRIYPVLVIKGTELESMYLQGAYKPLLMEEAVAWSKEVYKVFEKHGVRVIRMGLHPSEGLITGEELTAGPFHQSFRELVMTALWWDQLKILVKEHPSGGVITIIVHPKQLNFAIGYEAQNKKRLLYHFKTVVFLVDDRLMGRAHNTE